MTTLTGFVASVVVHSSAAAFAHFGLSVDAPHADKAAPPPAEHVVARTKPAPQKLVDCPERRAHSRVDKA